LLKPVVDFPLENLILVENMRSRSSQPRQAPERQAVKKPYFYFFFTYEDAYKLILSSANF
jgi:hypothetical protein